MMLFTTCRFDERFPINARYCRHAQVCTGPDCTDVPLPRFAPPDASDIPFPELLAIPLHPAYLINQYYEWKYDRMIHQMVDMFGRGW